MDKFSINSYVSLMNTEGKFWVIGDSKMYELVNFLINMGMVFNRWIYQVVDLGLQIFMSNTVFEDMIGSVFKVAVNLYNALFSALGITLFIFAVGSIFFVYAFKSPQESFRKLITLFMVIGFNFAIYSNGQEYLTDVNNIFDEVETVISKAITLPMFNEDGSQTEVQAGSSDSVKTMRETYFKSVMRQSFSMMNFGTSIYEERFDKFLYTKEQENDETAKTDLQDFVKEESEQNRYMTPDGAGDKFFISVYVWVSNLFVGIPLLIMAMLKFLLKILILCMVFGLPIVSILSLIPKFGNSLMNALGKMMMVFFISLFLSVAMYLFFFVMALIDSTVITMAGGSSVVSCILGAIVKAVAIILILKFRNQIVSFVTGGHVTRIGNLDNQMLKAMKKSGRDNGNHVFVGGDSSAKGEGFSDLDQEREIGDIDARDYVDEGEDETPDTNENRDDSTMDDQEDVSSSEDDEVGNPELDPIEVEDIDDIEAPELEEPENIDPIETEDIEEVDIPDHDERENSDIDSISIDEIESPDIPDFEEIEDVEMENKEESEVNSSNQQEHNINSNVNSTVDVNDIGEEPPIAQSEEDATLFYQELDDLRG